jgi:hypothetical protein
MTRGRRWACLFAAIGALAWSAPAFADDPSQAQELLRQGVQLRREHKDQEALAAFERANAMVASPVARGQMALAQQSLGDWLAAETNLRAALEAPADPWIVRNRAALDEALVEIEAHLAWLEVDVNVAEADVALDGRPIPGKKGRIVAGRGVLEVRAPGYAPDIRAIDIRPGARAQLTIALVPLVAQPLAAPPAAAPVTPAKDAPVRPTPSPRGSPSRVAPLLVGAAGLAAIGVGAYFGIRTFNDVADKERLCSPRCSQAGFDADSDARMSATVSTVSFGIGIAGVATSAVWLVLQRRSTAASGIVPVARRDGGGIVWSAVF